MPMYDFTTGGSGSGVSYEVGSVVLATEAPSADWLPLDGSEHVIEDYDPALFTNSPLVSPVVGPMGDLFISDHVITLANPAGFTKATQAVVSNESGNMVLYFSNSVNYRYSLNGGATWQNSTVSFPKPMVSGKPYVDGSNYILLCDNERAFYKFDPFDFSCTLLFDIYDTTVVTTPVNFYEWIKPDVFVFVLKDDAANIGIFTLGANSSSQFSLAPPATVGNALGFAYLNGDVYYATDGAGATVLGNIFRLSTAINPFGSYRLESVNLTYKMPNTNVRVAPATIASTDKSLEILYTTNPMKNTSQDGETFVSGLSYASVAPKYFRIYGTSYVIATGGDSLSFSQLNINFAGLEGDPTFVDSSVLETGFDTLAMTYCKQSDSILHAYTAPGSYGVSKIAAGVFKDDKFRTRYVKSPTIGLSYFVKGK